MYPILPKGGHILQLVGEKGSGKTWICLKLADSASKNEDFGIWKAYDQASANCGKHQPLVFIKRNRSKTLAVVEAEYFINLHK